MIQTGILRSKCTEAAANSSSRAERPYHSAEHTDDIVNLPPADISAVAHLLPKMNRPNRLQNVDLNGHMAESGTSAGLR